MTASSSSLWAAQEFAQGLALAIESMTGAKPVVDVKQTTSQPEDLAHSGTLIWRQAFTHAPAAFLELAAPMRSWQGIGDTVLTAALIDQVDDAMTRDTFRELAGQAFGALAHALTARLGREVACLEPTLSSSAGGSFPFSVLVHAGDEILPLYLAVADAAVEPGDPASGQAHQSAIAGPAHPPGGLAVGPLQANRLDLLLDVQLPVSVSFGQSQLPLKDVIKLTTGSIVELNRTVSEPVEVIVNNCVIARGEVVVVEGNFGVRIQHVVSRQERLRSIE
jgi:flagellar motor switch protein FliN/FliY